MRELFNPRLIGQDPHRTEGLWSALYQETLLNGRHGAVMRALSAVDIALWDRNARAAGLPLWRYLGAFHAEDVPAYASGGYYVDGGVGEVVAETESHVADGFDAGEDEDRRLPRRRWTGSAWPPRATCSARMES